MAANDSHSTGLRGGGIEKTQCGAHMLSMRGIGRVLTINGEQRLWVVHRSISGRSALYCAL
jgi:hypothetical protein